jgi:ABC-type transport system substrate-binding protein
LGTGPYKFVEYVSGEKVTIEYWDGYWGDPPAIKTIEFRPIPEEATRVAGLKTGELDIIQSVPMLEIATVEADPDLHMFASSNGEIHFICLNVSWARHPSETHPEAWDDLRVRQAMNYALDRQAINDAVAAGNLTLLNTHVASSLPSYDPTMEGFDYDPDLARQLLEDANFDFSQEFEMIFPIGRWAFGEDAALAMCDYWGQVGVQVTPRFVERSGWVDHLISGDLEGAHMIVLNASNLFFDNDYPLGSDFGSESALHYWSSPEFDDMLTVLGTKCDPDERIAYMREMYKYLNEEIVPVVWLWENYNAWGVNDRVDWEMGGGLRFMHLYQATLVD